jgi:hypothetical protein
MTGMSVVGGNSPVGTDMMEKNRFVILFNTTGRKRSVSKDLKKASVIPFRDYWRSFSADCYAREITRFAVGLGPTNKMIVSVTDTNDERHISETYTNTIIGKRDCK